MDPMRAYWEFAARAFSRNLAYRVNVWLRVVGSLAAIVIQVEIWRALLAHGVVAGVDLPQMVTYSLLSTCAGIVLPVGMFRTVDERLRTGNIAIDLVKPLSYPLYLAAESLGTVGFSALFVALPTLVVAALFFGLRAPASPLDLLGFAVALLLGLAVGFALGYLIALLAFWFLTTMHFEWSLGAFMKVFSGAFLPLWFFPPWLAALGNGLPFRYMNFVPVAIYLGKVPAGAVGGMLLLGLLWVAVLLGLAAWIWSRSVRRLVVHGG